MNTPAAPARLRVVVTRPQPQADEWVAKLALQGLDAAAMPLLGIEHAPDPASVLRAWAVLPTMSLVMFVSPNAVQRFFALRPAGPAWPAGVIAGGTGPGTRHGLLAAGVPADWVQTPGADDPAYAGPFDSEALWQRLAGRDWAGRQAMIVRGEGGREWLAQALRQQGAQVHFVEAYRRTGLVPQGQAQVALQAALLAPARHLWLLSSSEALGHLGRLLPGQPWPAHQALATHPRIAGAAAALGFGRVGLCGPTPQAVAQAVRAWPQACQGVPPAGAPPIQSAPS